MLWEKWFSALGMLILNLHWYLKLLEIAIVITRKSNFYAIIEKKVQKLFYGNAPTDHCKVVSPKRESTKMPNKLGPRISNNSPKCLTNGS
jgi:hypothetical protein